MEVKNDILWRVYLCFIGILLIGLAIIFKIFTIQNVEGDHWRSIANQMNERFQTLEAERGTIFSADGRMLSTSLPKFNLHMDFRADGIVNDEGKAFHENIDTLSLALSHLFKDRSQSGYKQLLLSQYKKGSRYFLLKRGISFEEYRQLRDFPFFNQGKNRSGLIVTKENRRANPFGLLANRTVGLYRDSSSVGLEAEFDEYLRGVEGKVLTQRISGGQYIPIEQYKIEPVNGKDIVTTLDINIQDITQRALMRMMTENEAEHGTCIVMDVKTGQIKALVNLGRQQDGHYFEDYNYGIGSATEPGSVFKLATMIALLEDKKVKLDDIVDLGNGTYRFGNRSMNDAAGEATGKVTVAHAFIQSSNVGMSKLVYNNYKDQPSKYINHLKRLGLDGRTGIDLPGEAKSSVKSPEDKLWSHTTLPWTSIGYEVLETPLTLLTLYNAVANNGKMMKPYLVSAITDFGIPVKNIKPTVLKNKICSDETLKDVQFLLNGVVEEKYGTGHRAIHNPFFKVSGKTGTALVANGKYGYSQRIYQSTFVGYFPSDNPQYSCIVTIKNKPHAAKYYAASVAAPVFKEVAQNLYAMSKGNFIPDLDTPAEGRKIMVKSGDWKDAQMVLKGLELSDLEGTREIAQQKESVSKDKEVTKQGDFVPDVRGMGLKDALYLLEEKGLQVNVQGKGSVTTQSIRPGQEIIKGQKIVIQLS